MSNEQITAADGKRVLLISADLLPYPGLPTTGVGLRAWGLGKGLESRGHHVSYSMPAYGLNAERRALLSPDSVKLAWQPGSIRPLLDQTQPDVLLVCGWPVLANISDDLALPVMLDQHGPHILERYFQRHGQLDSNIAIKLNTFRRADFFICAGEKQRLYFLPWLMQAGFDPSGDRFATVPVSLSPDLPERRAGAELAFVYGGVFLPWQDPSLALTILVEEMERHERGTLHFFGGRHLIHDVAPGIFESISKQLAQSRRVVLHGMQPHDRLIDAYRQAHAAIDLMARNAERELAFTTRTVEYLWCGLPVIYNDYAELSGWIREYNAGWTLNPADAGQVRRTISLILDRPQILTELGRNAQQLIREQLTWDRTIAPLDQFVRAPLKRPRSATGNAAYVAPANKTAGQLLDEAIGHHRRGGAPRLARETYGFLRRRLERR